MVHCHLVKKTSTTGMGLDKVQMVRDSGDMAQARDHTMETLIIR